MSPTAGQVSIHVVLVHVSERSSTQSVIEKDAGTSARVIASFEPTLFTRLPKSLQYKPWPDHNVAEMQICFSLDTPCDPIGPWLPFAVQQEVSFPVDWLGTRQVWVVAQFRDTGGQAVPGLGYGDEVPRSPVQVSRHIVGVVDLTTPIGQQPPFVQTAVAATQVVFPVEGSVEIEGGRCCAGGVAGQQILLNVAFEARSAYGRVAEMRTVRGLSCDPLQDRLLEEIKDVPWEPFVPTKTYTATLDLNWVGWYIAVQYRDEGGRLSLVYCDSISLEGMPSRP